MAPKLLSGKAIIITRPRRQARELLAALKRHGAHALAAPTIKIGSPSSWRGLDMALRHLEEYNTIIFTSANGVSQFFARARRVLRRNPARPRHLYAIGPTTSRALQGFGWRGVSVPEKYEGEALAKHIAKGRTNLKGRTILIPRAKVAREVLPRALKQRGARVNVVEAYRTTGDPSGLRIIRNIARNGQADFVTFTSSSTVEQFMKALPPAQIRRFFSKTKAASIGPVTSSTLRRFGIKNIVQARTFTTDGLIRAILRDVRYTPSPSSSPLQGRGWGAGKL